jgi:hypothetical protein
MPINIWNWYTRVYALCRETESKQYILILPTWCIAFQVRIIYQYISKNMQRHTVYLYLETAPYTLNLLMSIREKKPTNIRTSKENCTKQTQQSGTIK